MKLLKILLGVLLVLLFIISIIFGSALIQEKNTGGILSSIAILTLSGKDIQVISENSFVTHTQGGRDVIVHSMKEQGFTLKDQMGSGYFFENANKKEKIVTSKQYSRYFTLWTIN